MSNKEGKTETLQYDSLILALGAAPFNLPIEASSKEGVNEPSHYTGWSEAGGSHEEC